jgi:ADP-ribose pyrophosphatase YjhB (NUDIX family)
VLEVRHGVRVFVFRATAEGPRYLLVRPRPRNEWPWVPVIGAVNLDEHLQDAVLREVREETGLARPLHLIDLKQQQQTIVGDLGLVEWQFAFQVPAGIDPRLQVGPRIQEYRWAAFDRAFQEVENLTDRDGLVRLQFLLKAG